MNETYQTAGIPASNARLNRAEARIEKAEVRAEQAETRTEQAKTRAEQAETRTERAETRTELAKTRAEQAEIRTEQAETRAELAESALESVVQGETNLPAPNASPESKSDDRLALERLTTRQREVLRFIAQGENTKQIADLLKLSPKTVEYHRLKVMSVLDVHDIPGLVRFALRVGLVPVEG